MRIRITLALILTLFLALPTHAVLKEKDLGQTLHILRQELWQTHEDIKLQQARLQQATNRMRKNMYATMARANQNALMLYSQKQDYVFDLTYACHEATNQYHQFKSDVKPFRQWAEKSDNEEARYDSLIVNLMTMPVVMLDEQAKIDRNVCLALAVNLRRNTIWNRQVLEEFMFNYNRAEHRLKNLNDYAQKRYVEIQNNIFVNGGDNYIAILKNLGRFISQSKESVTDKYTLSKKVHSQWKPQIILFLFGAILFYGVIAVLLNILAMRFVVHTMMKRGLFNENIRNKLLQKRACIIMATSVITLAIILGIIRLVMNQNFVLMASNLLTEFAWLMSVILISILIRVNSERTLHTFFIFSPLLAVGFLVISFRIVLIPNALVNLVFPPILLLCTLWQANVMRKYHKEVEKIDGLYAMITQMIFIASVICSWVGYTLMAVQLLIWWIMLLTCILSITCLKDYIEKYAEDHHIADRPITQTWFYYLFTKALIPSSVVVSILISIYWAADVFNLTEVTYAIFLKQFIKSPNFVVSLATISDVILMWFAFNYVNFIIKEFIYHHFRIQDESTAESRSVMFINVIQVLILGSWALISLNIFHVSTTWLAAIGGGLATGIGFASKDILENIYYGISLMAGRIKIGDIVLCDGVRGTVTSISYTSTMVSADNGSIIAFTNSQLFNKNYQNLTHNHGLIRAEINVGIAYGESIDKAREVLVEALSALPNVDTIDHNVVVIVTELSDSCVTLQTRCWIDAITAPARISEINECIYKTLNKNNIEIPFPQRDIHIRKD